MSWTLLVANSYIQIFVITLAMSYFSVQYLVKLFSRSFQFCEVSMAVLSLSYFYGMYLYSFLLMTFLSSHYLLTLSLHPNVLYFTETHFFQTFQPLLTLTTRMGDISPSFFIAISFPWQIADQFRAVGASMSARVSVVVGGQDRLQQCRELQSEPHIVVATPGRLYDILSLEKDFSFNKIQFLVLDEADR